MVGEMLLKLALLPAVLGLAVHQSGSPSATIQNGTVVGVHSDEYNQDFFLGVPFAQPPVGNLRFRQAQAINTTWSEPLQCIEYYPECVGYGSDQWNYQVSEDCLALNIVRPSGYEGQQLPIAVWIHGGGFIMGGASDRRYNLSFIVQNSVDMGKPIIGVSIPYRLSGWGFIDGQQVRDENVSNIGMHDQRQALTWVQENMAAFGGDPAKVTIWGESAGGLSVGIHLIAYGGRDDGLFSGAISESGNSLLVGQGYNLTVGQNQFNNISETVGCSNSSDKLQCLREVPYEQLNAAINVTTYDFSPYNDGQLIQGSQVDQLNNGNFIKVPYLTGSNTDEGASFGPRGINNDTAFKAYLRNTNPVTPLNDTVVETLAAVYPNIPSYLDVLTDVPLNYSYPANASFGSQFRRADAFGGDFTFGAGRRLTCQSWSKQNVSSYCYRFDIRPYPVPVLQGVPHFQEVAFVFDNILGVGYTPPISYPPFTGLPQVYIDAAQLVSRMWVSFVHDGTPNNHGLSGYPEWPEYVIESPEGVGEDFVFTVNETSHPERDDYRAPGIAYLNSLWKDVYGK